MNATGGTSTTSRTRGSNGRRPSPLVGRVAGGVIITGSLILTFTLGCYFFGSVMGSEFSPQLLQRRSFYFYEVPILGLQVWPITRVDDTGPVEQHVAAMPVVKKQLAASKQGAKITPRWDLVLGRRSATVFYRGDAEILCRYFDAKNAGNNFYWLVWSRQHPKLADVFWPVVLRLARQELYVFIPQIAELAESARTPQQLKTDMNRRLGSDFARLARTQQELEKHELAASLFTESLHYLPTDGAVWRDRATSWKALGEAAKAASDLAKAKNLGIQIESQESPVSKDEPAERPEVRDTDS